MKLNTNRPEHNQSNQKSLTHQKVPPYLQKYPLHQADGMYHPQYPLTPSPQNIALHPMQDPDDNRNYPGGFQTNGLPHPQNFGAYDDFHTQSSGRLSARELQNHPSSNDPREREPNRSENPKFPPQNHLFNYGPQSKSSGGHISNRQKFNPGDQNSESSLNKKHVHSELVYDHPNMSNSDPYNGHQLSSTYETGYINQETQFNDPSHYAQQQSQINHQPSHPHWTKYSQNDALENQHLHDQLYTPTAQNIQNGDSLHPYNGFTGTHAEYPNQIYHKHSPNIQPEYDSLNPHAHPLAQIDGQNVSNQHQFYSQQNQSTNDGTAISDQIYDQQEHINYLQWQLHADRQALINAFEIEKIEMQNEHNQYIDSLTQELQIERQLLQDEKLELDTKRIDLDHEYELLHEEEEQKIEQDKEIRRQQQAFIDSEHKKLDYRADELKVQDELLEKERVKLKREKELLYRDNQKLIRDKEEAQRSMKRAQDKMAALHDEEHYIQTQINKLNGLSQATKIQMKEIEKSKEQLQSQLKAKTEEMQYKMEDLRQNLEAKLDNEISLRMKTEQDRKLDLGNYKKHLQDKEDLIQKLLKEKSQLDQALRKEISQLKNENTLLQDQISTNVAKPKIQPVSEDLIVAVKKNNPIPHAHVPLTDPIIKHINGLFHKLSYKGPTCYFNKDIKFIQDLERCHIWYQKNFKFSDMESSEVFDFKKIPNASKGVLQKLDNVQHDYYIKRNSNVFSAVSELKAKMAKVQNNIAQNKKNQNQKQKAQGNNAEKLKQHQFSEKYINGLEKILDMYEEGNHMINVFKSKNKANEMIENVREIDNWISKIKLTPNDDITDDVELAAVSIQSKKNKKDSDVNPSNDTEIQPSSLQDEESVQQADTQKIEENATGCEEQQLERPINAEMDISASDQTSQTKNDAKSKVLNISNSIVPTTGFPTSANSKTTSTTISSKNRFVQFPLTGKEKTSYFVKKNQEHDYQALTANENRKKVMRSNHRTAAEMSSRVIKIIERVFENLSVVVHFESNFKLLYLVHVHENLEKQSQLRNKLYNFFIESEQTFSKYTGQELKTIHLIIYLATETSFSEDNRLHKWILDYIFSNKSK